jgi:hypothetical protein
MGTSNPTDRPLGDPISFVNDDAVAQSAVLAILLAEFPVQLTFSELVREIFGDVGDFGQRDAVKRAVRDLAGVGLLHCQGIFVLPSRVALYNQRVLAVA